MEREVTEKITAVELDTMFPEGVPMTFMKVLHPERCEPLTADEVRHIGIALAQQQRPRDPVSYRSMMELMHRFVEELKDNGKTDRSDALFALREAMMAEFPEAERIIHERWGAKRSER